MVQRVDKKKSLSALKKSVKAVLLQIQKESGVTSAEAVITKTSGLSTAVRMQTVDTIEFNQDKSLGLTVYFGQQKGSVATSDLSTSAISDAIQAACRIAQYTEPDPYGGLADPKLLAKKIQDLDLYHPWALTPEDAIQQAKSCEDTALSFDKRICNSEGASISSHEKSFVYGNTEGFLEGYKTSYHSLSCVVVAKDKAGMQRDYEYTVARDQQDLEQGVQIGKKASQKTLDRLGAVKLKTTKAPVIFLAPVARGLFGSFLGAISGGALYRKASFLVDHLEKTIFPEFVNIEEKPHVLKGLGSAPFDSEGVATKDKYIIENGILKSYLLNSYAARKLGMETTGNAGGVHNLCVTPGTLDFDRLLQQMDTGFLVTELLGHGINLVTGDYSRGASGFWVEKGKIQYPVHEVTVAGNLKDIFANIVAIGNDVDKRGNIQTGSLLLEAMMIAGD